MNNDEYVDGPIVPTDDKLAQIAKLGKEYVALNTEIEDLERYLTDKKKLFNRLSTEIIPEAMHSVGMTAFEIGNRYTIKVAPVLVVKLPKENVDTADQWLTANGHAGMVKHHLEVFVPKNIEENKLEDLKRGIEALDFEYSITKNIHYQTLNRWSREMEENGEIIPTDIFDVYKSSKTVIVE